MRTPIMAANWKMNKSPDEARDFCRKLVSAAKDIAGIELIICPSPTSLFVMKEELDGTGIHWGGQNMHCALSGPFTGETSPLMLKSLGCTYVIIGHSERRWIFGESEEWINKKLVLAWENDLVPILCVGERLEEREAGTTKEVLRRQIDSAFKNIKADAINEIVLAYEPVWAIGTGKNATSEDARDGIVFIRRLLRERFGDKMAAATRILYGGSVKPANIGEYCPYEDIDGSLVGGASLEPDSFFELARIWAERKSH